MTSTLESKRAKFREALKIQPYRTYNTKACIWCKRTYGCHNYERVVIALTLAEIYDANEMLRILGSTGSEDITYFVNNHPNEKCKWAHDVLKGDILHHSKLRTTIYKRGLCHGEDLEEIITRWVYTGEEEKLCMEILDNNYSVRPYFIFYPDTNETSVVRASVVRFIKYFERIRAVSIRRGTCKDTGQVYIKRRLTAFTYSGEVEFKATEENIEITFPKSRLNSQNKHDRMKENKKRKIMSEQLRRDQYKWMIRLLLDVLSVNNTIIMKNDTTMRGQALSLALSCPSKVLAKTLKKDVFERPKGLMGLCINKMVDEFRWRACDVEDILPKTIVDNFF